MRINKNLYLPLLSSLILSLSFCALLINYYGYNFPGNNYFPENTHLLALIILIIYLGLVLTFGKKSRESNSGKELLYFFAVMSLIAFATNAVQLTPFHPIDVHIVKLESKLNINMIGIVTWTNKYPLFKKILELIYDSLPYQMSIIPLLIIASGRFYLLREYYFLLLVSTLIGFLFYYFFPTTAPASMFSSPLFSSEQIATGFKFNQIHNHINPTTIEGGLIALPSFHTVWAILCVYLLKEWMIPFVILLTINIFLIGSCVLLGWHYPIDLLGGLLLAGFSYYLLIVAQSKSSNSSVQ